MISRGRPKGRINSRESNPDIIILESELPVYFFKFHSQICGCFSIINNDLKQVSGLSLLDNGKYSASILLLNDIRSVIAVNRLS